MLKARLVWKDLKLAHQLLEQETDPDRFRIFLVAALALVRAIGHVLKNADGQAQLKPAVESAYKQWKDEPEKHKIFWEFIEQERNRVLKEYELNFDSNPVVAVFAGKSKELVDLSTLSDNFYCPIAEGPFAGDDIRDVLEDAITWWDAELTQIERSV